MIAYVSNYFIQGMENDWRIMLGVVSLPSLLFSILILLTPETPQFLLLKRNDLAGARKVLELADPNPEETINRIQTNANKNFCLLYTSPSPRDYAASRMPSSA